MFPPIKKPNGELAALGTTRQSIKWEAMSGPISSAWTTSGSPTTVAPTAGAPGLSWALAAGASVNFSFASDLDISRASAVMLTLNGLRTETINSIVIRLQPTTVSAAPNTEGSRATVRAYQNAPAVLTTKDTSAASPTIYSPVSGGGVLGALSLSMLWSRDAQCVYLLEGKDVVGAMDVTGNFITPATMQPRATFVADSVSPGTVHLMGAEVTVWYD